MAKDLWHDSTAKVPMDEDGTNTEVVRIGLKKNDIGARKSHTAGAQKKNNFTISHVKS